MKPQQKKPQMLDGSNGLRPSERTMTNDIAIATWNVQTMLKPVKIMETANEILSRITGSKMAWTKTD